VSIVGSPDQHMHMSDASIMDKKFRASSRKIFLPALLTREPFEFIWFRIIAEFPREPVALGKFLGSLHDRAIARFRHI
jgi:hypothetical protein